MGMIEQAMSQGKFRVVLRSKADGSEFPIYVEKREEADDAAAFLKADVVSVVPTSGTGGEYAADLINALARGTNVINK